MHIRSFYFAHPVTQYGTPVENEVEHAFHERFPDARVENPNQPVHQEGFNRRARLDPVGTDEPGMSYFVDLCSRQDGVFFTTFSDGSVGAGVAREVGTFLARKAPVYYFNPRTREFTPTPEGVKNFKVLSLDETRKNRTRERALIEKGQSPYVDLERYSATLQRSTISTLA